MQGGGGRRVGSRIGNVRVARGRRRREVVEVRPPVVRRPVQPSPLYLIYGFAIVIAIGTGLLSLPFATESGGAAPFMIALFTATSAVCVTGLVVVDTGTYWGPFGEAVIFVLIFAGGLGFMTSSTLLFVLFGRRLSLWQRVQTMEAMGRLGGRGPRDLVRRIVIVSTLIQLAGGAVMAAIFLSGEGLTGRNLWRGMFTGVSAFNNAGFDLEGGFRSLEAYAGNPFVLGTTMILVILGGTGYAIWSDVARRRGWGGLAVETKIVLLLSVALWFGGAAVMLLMEIRPGGIFEGIPFWRAAMDASAESVYGRTAGFSAVAVGDMRDETLFFLLGVMFIGGASGSTAGGIKITTFAILFFAIVASMRGEEHVSVFRREISWRHVNRALSVALLSVAVVFALAFGLTVAHDAPFAALLFEAVSAFATVGLSTGVTAEFGDLGRLSLVVGMFVGRLGPLTVALSLAGRAQAHRFRYPEEEVSIG